MLRLQEGRDLAEIETLDEYELEWLRIHPDLCAKVSRIIDAQATRIAELERIAAYRGDEIRRQDRLIGHGCAGTAHVKALTARIAELEAQLGRVEEVRKTMCLVGAMHWASRLANAMHTEPRG
jgi:hypothetical protein